MSAFIDMTEVLTTSEKYFLAQILVAGDISYDEACRMSEMMTKTKRRAWNTLHDKKILEEETLVTEVEKIHSHETK